MIEVCREEKMNEILARYKAYNDHAESYTWKYHCNELNMNKTLGKRFLNSTLRLTVKIVVHCVVCKIRRTAVLEPEPNFSFEYTCNFRVVLRISLLFSHVINLCI